MYKIKAIRKLAHILFSTAVLFLLLHNITPHLHHADISHENDCEEQQAPEGFLDWLALSLHFDLGEGHLEYFPQVNKTDIDSDVQVFLMDDFQALMCLADTTAENIIHHISSENASIGKCDSQYLFLSTPLRGPPLSA